jgi:hypothetical protein
MPVSLAPSTPPSFTAELEQIMRSRIRPISLLFTPLFLSLIFTNAALAFECANAGAAGQEPNDNGDAIRTACGNAAAAEGTFSTAVGASAVASGFGSTALGVTAAASGSNSTALGHDAAATGDSNTALGTVAFALSPNTNATAIGYQAQVEQSNAMVLGSIPGVNNGTAYVDVGIGTTMPQAPLHVERANGTARVQVTETQPGPSMPFQGQAQGLVRFELNDEAAGERWRFTNAGDKFAINNVGGDSPGTEMSVFKNGDLVIGGLLTENSDRDAKQNIVPLVSQDILAKIVNLEVLEWSYIDAPNQRHIGPMAQDFHSAFGLGRDNKHIATLDTSGVALVGIQALAEENTAIRTQYESIQTQNEALLQQNAELSERLAALERQQAETQAMMARLLEAQLAQPVLTRSLAN